MRICAIENRRMNIVGSFIRIDSYQIEHVSDAVHGVVPRCMPTELHSAYRSPKQCHDALDSDSQMARIAQIRLTDTIGVAALCHRKAAH
jgi:hypothetical protein